MKTIQRLLGAIAVASIAACGGGSADGNGGYVISGQGGNATAAHAISVGTGNTIAAVTAAAGSLTSYQMPWTFYVVDVHGVAVTNAQVTFTLAPIGFVQGQYVWYTGGTSGTWTIGATGSTTPSASLPPSATLCGGAGVPTALAGVASVSASATSASSSSSAVVSTDSTGAATAFIYYTQTYANWVVMQLTATVTGQDGVHTVSSNIPLPALSGDMSLQSTPPGGSRFSPYNGLTCPLN